MPLLTDMDRVRSLLNRDRAWSAYAIGDLAPEHAVHCSWHGDSDESALVLVYRGFSPAIVFAMGDSAGIGSLMGEVAEPVLSLHLQESGVNGLAPRYTSIDTRAMWRMVVSRESFRGTPTEDVVAVEAADVAAITALYERGWSSGDGPTFFHPSMLDQGTFRGIREGADLVAVAGTHLYSRELGVCTIGNVYTRRDRRGRGLAAQVTSAVVQHALTQSVSTIVLNVSQDNDTARRVYERLGFHCHCPFFEGEARLALAPGDSPRR